MSAFAIHLVFLITIGVLSVRALTHLRAQSPVLQEFTAHTPLPWLVCLIPLAAVMFLLGRFIVPPAVAYAAAIVCPIPALVAAHRADQLLQRAGTDRVRGAKEAVSTAFLAALTALIYGVLFITVSLSARFLSQSI